MPPTHLEINIFPEMLEERLSIKCSLAAKKIYEDYVRFTRLE